MRKSWGDVVAAAVVVVTSVLLCLLGMAISGHGTMQDPISRIYNCYREGPERPTSAACQAAVAVGGTQPLYDWNEVSLANAAGRHRELIPNGKLCSAGREKYRGLDLARADWGATTLSSGVHYTFLYRVTAPHLGFFEFYVTRDTYDATLPLTWDDLEHSPFINITDPAIVSTPLGNAYRIPGTTPSGKTGRQLIYVIWQRSDSPEAFYACCDVEFSSDHAPRSAIL